MFNCKCDYYSIIIDKVLFGTKNHNYIKLFVKAYDQNLILSLKFYHQDEPGYCKHFNIIKEHIIWGNFNDSLLGKEAETLVKRAIKLKTFI